MLLWFVITAPILVAEVFRSPMVDYRLVALGAFLPLIETATGVFLGLHTLLGSVLALGLVMAATSGRRLLRRRLLGIPIGMFCHLLLDGAWTRTELFWWPSFGWSGVDAAVEATRHPALLVAMELAALGLGWWAWKRYDLGDAANRQLLMRRGHLARGVL